MKRREIIAARILAGWEQVDLAREAGLSRRSVQNAETGGLVRPSTLSAIRDALARVGVTWGETDRALHMTCERR